MALLAEYALTPDVFDRSAYSSESIGDLHLQGLKEVLLNEALVRNLRDGEWGALFTTDSRPWHRRGKELLKKLRIQKRLVPFPAALPRPPGTDEEWCREALASHEMRRLAGIISTDSIASQYGSNELIASVERLSTARWWTERSPSLRVARTLQGYASALALILRHANSIMVIDRNFDPRLARFRDFIGLLGEAGGRNPCPLLEIHRVCYTGSGRDRQVIAEAEWEAIFRREMTGVMQRCGLSPEIFIWDDFHDRFIISDLIGISAQNSFDTTGAPSNLTTWTRLGRADRDDIQREFDPASGRHRLRTRFTVS